MRKELKIMVLGMAIALSLMTFSCVEHPSTPQALTPEQRQVLLNWALRELGRANQPYCWRQSYGRGIGVPVSACPKGQEKDGLLCYPTCESIGKKGWKGVGPVCWQSCPEGFRDDGAFCFKPTTSYGRGVGFPWKIGDRAFSLSNAKKRCEKVHGKGRCEKSGAIYYPKCKPGYRAIGCCVCSPRCPPGMTDIGISCQKKSKGRGVGKPMKCKAGQEYDAGLCYTPCKEHYHGVGPVCWQNCPATQPVNCGAGCAKHANRCVEQTLSQVLAPLEIAANVGMALTTGGTANAAVTAAKASAKTTAKTAGKAAAKKAVKASTRKIAQEMMPEIRAKLGKKLRRSYPEEIAEEVCRNAADNLAQAMIATDSDAKDVLLALDPTGIADVVDAYHHPRCGFDEPPPSFWR
ncbi:MAG: hypothetical protein JXA41_11625 [Deltaproteobacteria bacterium]|nr:hypothetical protein [Deltaproteobacteria bacterium]